MYHSLSQPQSRAISRSERSTLCNTVRSLFSPAQFCFATPVIAQTSSPPARPYGPNLSESHKPTWDSGTQMRPIFDQPSFLDRVQGNTHLTVQLVPTGERFDRRINGYRAGLGLTVEHEFIGPVVVGHDGYTDIYGFTLSKRW